MFRKTKFFIGVALIAQSLSFLITFVVLAIKKKSLWKTFLLVGLAGGVAGGLLTYSALRSDRKFRRVLDAVDDLCDVDECEDSGFPDVPTDDTASEDEFEG